MTFNVDIYQTRQGFLMFRNSFTFLQVHWTKISTWTHKTFKSEGHVTIKLTKPFDFHYRMKPVDFNKPPVFLSHQARDREAHEHAHCTLQLFSLILK